MNGSVKRRAQKLLLLFVRTSNSLWTVQCVLVWFSHSSSYLEIRLGHDWLQGKQKEKHKQHGGNTSLDYYFIYFLVTRFDWWYAPHRQAPPFGATDRRPGGGGAVFHSTIPIVALTS